MDDAESIIPYGRQTLGPEEVEAVVRTLKSPFLTQGPEIEAFEKAVANYCGVAYAVAFSSGTAALHAAYSAAGIGPGDEAITSPLTFVATSNAVLYQGGTPVFADIDPATWNLDPITSEKAITPRTKALLPVHFAGEPVDLNAFYALADQHKLVVIEDASHALGASYQSKPIGQCRDMAIFSFHPVKSITTGEGGMVVTPHRHYYEALKSFRTHGITKDSSLFQQFPADPWTYEMQSLGFNYRMTDLQAAMGTVQMSRLDDFVQRRDTLVQHYIKAFEDDSRVQFQARKPDSQSAHHLCVLKLTGQTSDQMRRDLFQALLDNNIRPQVHYIPVHLQPFYQQTLQTRPGQFPNAEAYYRACISLPLFPTLTDAEQTRVIHSIQKFLKSSI